MAEVPPGGSRARPKTEASYGIPAGTAGLLPWTFVADRLAGDPVYWVATTLPDGRPHTRPTWGVWLEDTLHVGGGRETRWVRNLARNQAISVHRESGEEVVIVEGTAHRFDEETTRLERIDDAYEAKYGVRHGAPVFAIAAEVVFAWSDFPTDATKWTFEETLG